MHRFDGQYKIGAITNCNNNRQTFIKRKQTQQIGRPY